MICFIEKSSIKFERFDCTFIVGVCRWRSKQIVNDSFKLSRSYIPKPLAVQVINISTRASYVDKNGGKEIESLDWQTNILFIKTTTSSHFKDVTPKLLLRRKGELVCVNEMWCVWVWMKIIHK